MGRRPARGRGIRQTGLARAVGLALLASLLATACGLRAPRVRIVLITIDTLRYDSLRETDMPRTLAFAREGQVFANFYAASSATQPTHASLFTGLHPWQHGVTRNGLVLDARRDTLAERLGAEGYGTSAVVASFPLERRFGFAQGFDAYHDEFHEPYMWVWQGEEPGHGRFYSLAEDVTDVALEAIDRARERRQFFWIHYFDPHDPYGDAAKVRQRIPIALLVTLARGSDPDIEKAIRRARALYNRDVRSLDRALGRLLDRLRADADEIETHVILTSDHGESFGELGCIGHGNRLTREQVHVPLVLVSPALSPGIRKDPAGSIDVARTIAALAGLDAEPFPGRDLSRVDDAATAFGMRSASAEAKTEQLADGSVLPVAELSFFTLRGGALFSGNSRRVLVEDDPARIVADASIRDLFASFEGALEQGGEAEELLDAEVREALEKLGYAR